MRRSRRFLQLVGAALAIWFVAIEVRLFHLQVVDSPGILARAEGMYKSTEDLLARRGRILTRNGCVLAESLEAVDVYADHRRTEGRRDAIAAELSTWFEGEQASEIRERLEMPGYRRILRRPLDRADAIIALSEARRAGKLRGVDLERTFVRHYPEGSLAGNVVGFVNGEGRGCAGIEGALDDWLAGTAGFRTFARDAAQRRVATPEDEHVAPTDGCSVRLTLDAVVQYYAEQALDLVERDHRPVWSCCVVLDPRTGEILALANRPHYDPNEYGRAPLLSHQIPAVGFQYTPGSSFKPFILACALERGVVRLDEGIDCSEFSYRGRSVGEAHDFGVLTVAEILIKSSNRGMARIAHRLVPPETAPRKAQEAGFQALRDKLLELGFGVPTDLSLPSEARGYVPPVDKWSHKYTLTSISFGHEISVSAVQLAAAFSVFANGGVYIAPRLIDSIVRPDGSEAMRPVARIRRVFDRTTADRVRELLVRVVDEGTGKRAAIDGYSVAGKTSTAQWESDRSRYTASFVGFAPAGDPRLLALVVADRPRGKSHYGGTVAAPAVAYVLEKSLSYQRVPKDRPEMSSR